MKKCTICNQKFNQSISAKSFLSKNELTVFDRIKRKQIICDECKTDMFILQLT